MQFLNDKLTVFPSTLKTTKFTIFTDPIQFSQTFKALKSVSHFPKTFKDLQRLCEPCVQRRDQVWTDGVQRFWCRGGDGEREKDLCVCVSVWVCWVRVVHIKSYHRIYCAILVKWRSYTGGVKSPEHDANMTSLSRAPCRRLAQPRPCPLPVLKQLLRHLCLMPGGWQRWGFWQRQGCVWTAPGSAPPGSASARMSDWSPEQPDSRKKLGHQEPSTTGRRKTTLTSRAQHNLTAENNLDIKSPAQPDGGKQPWHQEPSTTRWLKKTWISGAQHNLIPKN